MLGCWDQHARIYGLGAQVDIPLILVMSRLDTILNPQDNDTPALRFEHLCYAEILTNVLLLYRLPLKRVERMPVPSPRLSPSSPTSSTGEPSRTSKISHSHQENKEHSAHPTCPDTLRCLPDTDGRPQHTLPVILRCAILGSKMKRLTIREIYAAMEEKYPYYRTAGSTWKVSSPLISLMMPKKFNSLRGTAISQTSSFTQQIIRATAATRARPWLWVILDC